MRPIHALVTLFVAAIVAGASGSGCTQPPTYVPDGAGGTGGASSGSMTTSTGTGMMCKISGDCSGTDNECQHRACVAGQCQLNVEPDGTLVGSQASGDCRRSVCDGKGRVKQVADPADIPNDANSCTIDQCMEGKPLNSPADASVACGASGALHCDGKGSCTGCMMDADCGAAADCVSYACVSGTCQTNYVPSGQGSPQGGMKGDCHKLVCNGMGAPSLVIDDTDVPDDGNPCTQGACSMGAPSQASSMAGASCGGNAKCDGKGTCSGCKVDADCGVSGACATFSCVNGGCMNSFVPMGQGSPPGDVPGDCHRPHCDGNGGVYSAADDSDVPVDGNVCTSDHCSNGVPSNPALPANTPCGNLHCDGAGSCTGCTTGADCGASGACSYWSCQNSFCSQQNIPYGGGSFGQTGGDCHRVACDGSGNQANLVDDSDAAADGNPCTQDACNNGNNWFPPVPSETGCPGGVCDGASSCVQCVSNGDCPVGSPPCLAYQCIGNGCQPTYAPYGTAAAGQTGGDCLLNVCDGGGGQTVFWDNNDPPAPWNICYSTYCSAGMGVQAYVNVDDGNACTNDYCDPTTGIHNDYMGDYSSCGPCDFCYSGFCYNQGC